MKIFFISILFIFFTISALAQSQQTVQPETKKIKTPRDADVEVSIHPAIDPHSPTIIVAPGQGCNSKGPLFEALGKNGALSHFTVVRFEWAYCLKDSSKPIPSPDLKNEIEDFTTVLSFAKTLESVDPRKLIIAGKSLGSIVAYSVFQANPTAKALILLTPVCSYTTDENDNPLAEPLNVCEESYPGLKKETRPVLMTMGDQDSLCILNILFNYLQDSAGNIHVIVAGGDHGFRIKKSDGSLDVNRTARNIDVVVKGLLNWIDLKVNP